MENCGEKSDVHASAVLHLCEVLTASGHSVISANTDASADPQIFAQSDSGELAFYFVRVEVPEPSPAEAERFRALAAKHRVAAYYADVERTPALRCGAIRPL